MTTRLLAFPTLIAAGMGLALAVPLSVVEAQQNSAPATASAEDDAAAKNVIFSSDEWRRTRVAFDEWLSIQRIFDDQQVRSMKDRLRKQIATSSAADLRTLQEQMAAKMEILLSPEASDARRWLGHFVSPEVIFTREELNRFDIVSMTPAQVREMMQTFESRRAARRSQGAAFNASREQQAQRTMQAGRDRRQSNAQTRSSAQAAAQSRAAQTPLAPRQSPSPPRPRAQIFVGPGGAGFVLPGA